MVTYKNYCSINYLYSNNSNMGRYNFKGDISEVPERQLAYIGEVLEKRGVKGPDVLIEPVGKVGDNYIANVKRITVHDDGQIFKMIAKVAPQLELVRRTANIEMLFRNEHIIYTEILPKFKNLQIEAGVPKEEMFRHPECYGSLSEPPNEIILLEDLKESEFDTVSRYKPMSTECVNITLKNLAKFHSLSYALKKLEPETFESFKSKLGDMISEHMESVEGVKMYFVGLERMAIDCMSSDKYKNLIKGTVGDIISHCAKCVKSDKNSRFSVIRQGDGWTNNIMFRMKNDTPEECVLIDYQVAYESSPAYDIMYMLFNSTDHEQRLKHYYNFIDLYHSELDKSLNDFGLKANFVYPRDQLDADLQRYAKFAFGLSIMISSVMIKTPEEAALVKKSITDGINPDEEIPEEYYQLQPKTMVLFQQKLEDLVDSFLEFGLLTEKHNKIFS